MASAFRAHDSVFIRDFHVALSPGDLARHLERASQLQDSTGFRAAFADLSASDGSGERATRACGKAGEDRRGSNSETHHPKPK